MGLDNGIRVEINHATDKAKWDLPEEWKEEWNGHTWYEPVYMRKWWSVRNMFVDYLVNKYEVTDEEGAYELSIFDIATLCDILYEHLDADMWDGEYWIFDDDIAAQIGRHIARLRKLIQLKKLYPELPVVFYDSY